MTEPFVALMRRYVIDYTCSHDLSVCDEIMDPEYVVHISGMELPRDTAYKPSVEMIFGQFPGLGLVVHELVTNGDRLAMRFSEHAADTDGKFSVWAGVSLYRWNGTKLTECRVEEDFLAQKRQIETGEPALLEPPHVDPWTTTRALEPRSEAERVVTEWLEKGNLQRARSGQIDDVPLPSFEPIVDDPAVEIRDLFSAGSRVAFQVSMTGGYRGGLPSSKDFVGKEASIGLTGLATASENEISDVRIVSDRLGAWSRLTGQPMF